MNNKIFSNLIEYFNFSNIFLMFILIFPSLNFLTVFLQLFVPQLNDIELFQDYTISNPKSIMSPHIGNLNFNVFIVIMISSLVALQVILTSFFFYKRNYNEKKFNIIDVYLYWSFSALFVMFDNSFSNFISLDNIVGLTHNLTEIFIVIYFLNLNEIKISPLVVILLSLIYLAIYCIFNNIVFILSINMTAIFSDFFMMILLVITLIRKPLIIDKELKSVFFIVGCLSHFCTAELVEVTKLLTLFTNNNYSKGYIYILILLFLAIIFILSFSIWIYNLNFKKKQVLIDV